ncbi:MAG: hypothetical protein ACRCX2_14950 [Paraclostridium sp.]
MKYVDDMGNKFDTCGEKTDYARYELAGDCVLNSVVDKKASMDFIELEEYEQEKKEYEIQMDIYDKMVFAILNDKEIYTYYKLKRKGLSMELIASHYNIPFNTLKSKLYRANKKLEEVGVLLETKKNLDLDIIDIYLDICENNNIEVE